MPQRQRGFSPLRKQMKIKTVTRIPTQPRNNPLCFGSSNTAQAPIKIKYATKTSQPCQHLGGPQPQPYFLAGNQIFFSSGFKF